MTRNTSASSSYVGCAFIEYFDRFPETPPLPTVDDELAFAMDGRNGGAGRRFVILQLAT